MLGAVDQYKVVSLFPYQIKNSANFIQRDHIPYRPEVPSSVHYARETWRKIVEGMWVYDEGTWVYMLPKLFFYINLGTISYENYDGTREFKYPDMRDNEWIILTHILCCDGFSGFEGDEDYTCNVTIEKIENQEPVSPAELQRAEAHCRRPNGTWKKYMNAWDYLTVFYLLERPLDKPLGLPLYENSKQNGLLIGSRKTGKDLEENTIVHTETGKRPIKDIRIGDRVYGADGNLTEVISVDHYEDQMQYMVTFRDGRKVECGAGHLWTVSAWGGKYRTIPLSDIIKDYKKQSGRSKYYEYKYKIPNIKPINYTDSTPPIDPYFFGLWLGDGHKHLPAITTKDQEIADYCHKIAAAYGLRVRVTTDKGKCPSYMIVGDGKGQVNPLTLKLRELGVLNNKHIPSTYLEASVEDRLMLLKGLMDSDGTVGRKGGFTFSTSIPELHTDFVDLVRSLGISCTSKATYPKYTYKGTKKMGKLSYKVTLITNVCPFLLDRKIKVHENRNTLFNKKKDGVSIVDIQPTQVKKSVCIGVDNTDKLFIVNDYIATHNSFTVAGADMVQQFTTNGALRFEQLKKNTTTNMFVGSSDSNFVNSFLTAAETCWRNLPGGSDGRPSPFFRDAVGPWNSSDRKPIVQGYNVGGSEIRGSKSEIAKAVLQPHSAFSGVSKRLSRFYLDEIGLQTNSRSILEATDASLKADKGKSGVFYGTGTGGNIDAIVQTKDLMIHPHKYDMYSIPNYWADMSDMCLFIPVSYTLADYKDKHGNTDLLASTEYVVKERFEKSGGDSSKIVAKRQNEPLEPKEVYLSGKSDFFGSSKEIMMDRIEIMEAGLFDKRAQTYDLTLSRRPDGEYTVHPEIVDRMSNALLGPDILGKTGELIVVEPPTPHEGHLYTDNLYKIVYDLVQDITVTNTGTAKQKKERKLSYAYIAVYKGVPKRSLESEELYSTLVAFALFRRDDMSNHEMALKLAIWYQAKVLYEKNVSGVSGYFGKYNLTSYLQPTPYRTIKEVSPGTTQTKYDTGVYMTKELKSRGLREYQKWLTDICYIDNNNRAYRNAENLWDLALLYQTLQFNFDDNFDAVSGMVLLMLWLYEEHSPEEATEEAQYTESDYSELEAFVASYY